MRLHSPTRRTARLAAVGLLAASLALTACGAGSRTGAATATKVACDFTKPAQPTTVNVLAYNSSAVDPFSNTMVASCTHDNVTVKHDPIDFAGQLEKTTATLAGDSGTYDVVETYTYAIPDLASRGKLQPLDDLFAKHSEKYKLDPTAWLADDGGVEDSERESIDLEALIQEVEAELDETERQPDDAGREKIGRTA